MEMIKFLTEVQIKDSNELRKLLENRHQYMSNDAYNCRLRQIENMIDGNSNISFENTGRQSSSFLRFPDDYRFFLSYNDKSLGHADVSCSHPTLLGVIAKEELGCTEEVLRYIKCACSGKIYDRIAEIYSNLFKKISANEVKKKGWSHLFYADYKTKKGNNKLMISFEKDFPKIAKWLKAEDNLKLCHKMQNMEAYVITTNTAIPLAAEGMPVGTIYDSISSNLDNLHVIKDRLKEAYKNIYGIEPTIKKKEFKNENEI
jgi:hypothetical protein